MKDLKRIQPEPVHRDCESELNWLCKEETGVLYDNQLSEVVRLLIHKVNELTDEVNRMKNEK